MSTHPGVKASCSGMFSQTLLRNGQKSPTAVLYHCALFTLDLWKLMPHLTCSAVESEQWWPSASLRNCLDNLNCPFNCLVGCLITVLRSGDIDTGHHRGNMGHETRSEDQFEPSLACVQIKDPSSQNPEDQDDEVIPRPWIDLEQTGKIPTSLAGVCDKSHVPPVCVTSPMFLLCVWQIPSSSYV